MRFDLVRYKSEAKCSTARALSLSWAAEPDSGCGRATARENVSTSKVAWLAAPLRQLFGNWSYGIRQDFIQG